MITAYKKYLKNAGKFNGYASRSDYWWVFLANTIIFGILFALRFSLTSLSISHSNVKSPETLSNNATNLFLHPRSGILLALLILTIILGILILVPNMMLTARRLRDAAFPAWIAFIFGLLALYGILNNFLNFSFIGRWGFALNLLTFIIYILCIMSNPKKQHKNTEK
ncbi:DUF805 domain-containing protein [Lactococcus nasutitermitis]|uniref:DUF805 domain-containing protein n=1 Tax=Lactococcus nasutitermitis TaxID=1652957 RepID=A0ABV9JE45_9LACT|nr:DUF805 domain-containing protein [Lactococcus nasutitermitis]